MQNVHIPVLLSEVLGMIPVGSVCAFDGTLGGAGHTSKLLKLGLQVTSSDLDQEAITVFANTNPKNWKGIQGGFDKALETIEDNSLDFILADLGFSSNQLESGDRGFSYLKSDDVLDLRYDSDKGVPCWRKIQKSQEADLAKVLFKYSGEKFSHGIAKKLMQIKESSDKLTVGMVVGAIESVLPAKLARRKNPILSRIWQALRIWTNDEFIHLERFLDIAPNKLKKGGRVAIICFHSLEDKLVTKHFRLLNAPLVIDEYGNTESRFTLLTKAPIVPTEQEIEANPRSRSALLRVLQKN
jgi:16S rRNA (cytosine1402-N4)-methyltransferase